MTDQALFQQWVDQRDAEAFRELAARHAGMLYATCKRILKNAADAEDVTQECLEKLAVLRTLPRGHFGAWLHSFAVNGSLNRLRERARRVQREKAYAELNAAHTEVRWDDLYQYVDEAIAALPDKLHAPVVAHFLEGSSHAAVAESLGISRRAVTHRIAKGLEQIRRTLRRRGIAVAVGALSAMLAQHAAEAAPANIVATLGKLALAGTKSTLTSTTLITGGILIMAKKIAVLAALTIIALYFLYDKTHQASPTEPAPVTRIPAQHAEAKQTADEPTNEAVVDTQSEPHKESVIEQLKPILVSGKVVNTWGWGLANAQVVAKVDVGMKSLNPVTYETQTDGDGNFEFSVEELCYGGSLTAYLDGYQMREALYSRIEDRRDLTDLRIVLEKGSLFLGGRVVSEANLPISGASVTVKCVDEKANYRGSWGGGGANGPAITDAQGRFNIAVLQKKGYATVKVEKEGYGLGFFQGIMTGQEDVEFVLRSTGGVRGRVTWRDGGPANEVVVEAIGYRPIDAKNSFTEDYRTVYSDTQGGFELAELSPDLLYSISAHEPVDLWKTEGGAYGVRLGQLLYGEDTANCKKNVEISGGQMASVNLVIGGLARVYGHVVSAQHGTPEEGVFVQAVDEEEQVYGQMRTKEDGAFDLTLDLDQLRTMRMLCLRGCDDLNPRELPLAPGETKELELTIAGSMTVPIRLVDRNGRPVANVKAQARRRDVGRDREEIGKGEVGADGRTVVSGIYSCGERFDVVALRGDAIIGTSPLFDMEPGKTYPEVKIVCAPHGGISGIALDSHGHPIDAKGFAGLGCAAPLPDGSLCEPVYVMPTAAGEFTLAHALPEGTYAEVYLWYLADVVIDPSLPDDAEPETVWQMTTWDYRLGILKNVRINAGKVTPVGEVPFESVSRDELKAMGLINSSL